MYFRRGLSGWCGVVRGYGVFLGEAFERPLLKNNKTSQKNNKTSHAKVPVLKGLSAPLRQAGTIITPPQFSRGQESVVQKAAKSMCFLLLEAR